MILEIYNKNHALCATVEIETSHIPRVGETVMVPEWADHIKGIEEALVHEVTYLLKSNTLTPLVRCLGANGPELRKIILEENGWL